MTVRYHGLTALEDVSISLARGQVVGLLGPNGAGKTTMVNVLSGFTRPSSGTVEIDGKVLNRARPDSLARCGIVRTFQSVRLFQRMTVRENVHVPVFAHSAGRAEGEQSAQRALDFVGIADAADKIAGALPYTQERLVGIARALALEPQFLLLDEPAAGMNDAEGAQLVDLIARIPAEYGCGVLLIEHNMPVVMAVCEKLHVLREGRTLAVGGRDEVRGDPAVIEAYLGSH
ncbi:ABC transporter ATP-binding protein [Roseovarius atlanticus]|uniref:ABC transporter ATP-binding protein n=1 Tax=Roseovarius atlanticus TaxID=1641875 RepID=UPI001C990E66|nr:ABC transporter ATP-binding protein [Roseovarius atlanticus]MBY5989101.1 ABC transporter ATP-binding protein [Roseovarius atlanticus]